MGIGFCSYDDFTLDIICLVCFKLLTTFESAIASSPQFDLEDLTQDERNNDFILRARYFIAMETWVKPQETVIITVRDDSIYCVVQNNSPGK